MSNNYEKLKKVLAEVFQLDQADLDFGIYRIMNQKRGEITRFLEKDLLPQVKQAFAQYKPADKVEVQKELDDAIQQAKNLGANPDDLPKVKELKAKVASSVDLTGLENEVFSHLTNFFRRYYDKGDFISQRRYKEGVYAIPYEGEEVKLYWANHDQYYVKTSEYFRDYTFKLPSGRRVHFKLSKADTEKDNIKSTNGNDRSFILYDKEPIEKTETELILRFEYKPDEAKRTQKDLNAEALGIVANWTEMSDWAKELSILQPSEANPKRTLLEKHLNDYTARNTFDYFIHKDLGRFLRRELDFYIKNEIMHLDDIENESVPRIEQYVSMIKVVRLIAHKIITFLAQIEDFQKKLWLKKKFVIETNYCVTLDRVPEGLYPEIAANDAQRDEWVKLFAIDEITGDLAKTAYAEPLSVQFLKENPFLVVDTKFFGKDFKAKLLASFDNLDEQIDGLLVNSENFQALNLLGERYCGQVKSIYIDPPYNTDASPIMYKNGYRRSSWVSLLDSRLRLSIPFLTKDAILCATIDDFQQVELHSIISNAFGESSLLGTIAIRNNPSGRPAQTGFSVSHEYAIFAAASAESTLGTFGRSEKQNKRYSLSDEKGSFMWELLRKRGSDSERKDSPKLFYPLYIGPGSIRVPEMQWDKDKRVWIVSEEVKQDEVEVYPIDENGIERRWRWGVETAKTNNTELKVEKNDNGHNTIYYKYRPPKGTLPTTNWIDSKYSATEHGTGLLKTFFREYDPFSFPKSVYAVQDCIKISGMHKLYSTCLDYFGGSGTTGHAVINLNREDGGNRKYILVEMGEYFDTVLKPRISKVVYASKWKEGKPQKLDVYIEYLKKSIADTRKKIRELSGLETQEEFDFERQRLGGEINAYENHIESCKKDLELGNNLGSISHSFKYLRLESYEDALNNIEHVRTKTQETLLMESKSFKESYMLSYMLDVESKDSLLNFAVFEDPFNYKLRIASGSVGETQTAAVDLVETFNYLIGLTVRHIDHIQGYCVVQGINPKGEKVLVIWRNVKEKKNEDLEQFFRKQDYNPKDMEFAIIYVNGDNNLENIRREDETWKVRLIEEEFQRLMFSTEEA